MALPLITNNEFRTGYDGSAIDNEQRMKIDTNGDISFYEDTGTTAKFFWDAAAESLGIGTSSPSSQLDILGSSSRIRLDGSSAAFQILSRNTSDSATNPIIFDADTYTFNRAGSTQAVIDSSGNLLVGTTTTDLHTTSTETGSRVGDGLTMIARGGLGAGTGAVGYFNRLSTDGDIIDLRKDGSTVGSIGAHSTQTYIGTGDTGLYFNAGNDSVDPYNTSTPVARSDAISLGAASRRFKDLYLSGSVFSGATSGGAKVVAQAIATGTTYSASWPATGGTALYMQVNSSAVGSITTTTSATAYNTSSDYRLKTDVQPMTGASARVQALNPVNFEWIADGTRVDGFLAHEAQTVVPEAVTGTKDAMRDEEYEVTPAVLDDDGNVVTPAVMGTRSVPDYQGIDQSKLVPLLTAALQEALTKIDALEARITTLEG